MATESKQALYDQYTRTLARIKAIDVSLLSDEALQTKSAELRQRLIDAVKARKAC